MPGQPFEVWEVDGLPIVSAPAEIDIVNAGLLRNALLRAATVNPIIIVDLSLTEFCDSTGINVLIRALQRAEAEGGDVRLAACAPLVLRVLTVTGVGRLFRIFPSLIHALAAPVDRAPAG